MAFLSFLTFGFSAVAITVLAAAALMHFSLGNKAESAIWAARAAAVVGAYLSVLCAFSVVVPRSQLRVGDSVCYGNWCVSVVHAEREGGSIAVLLKTENRRDDGSVRPNSPRVLVLDDLNRPAESLGEPIPALNIPLLPHESLTRELVYRLPAGAKRLHLEITEGTWFSPLLIGSQNALFRPRPQFQIL
jgi:hypothetical protein